MTKYCASCNNPAEFDIQVQARRFWSYEQWVKDIRISNGEYCRKHYLERLEEVIRELRGNFMDSSGDKP